MKSGGLAHGGEANPLLHMVKSTVPLHGLPHGARSVLISLLSLALRPHRCVLSDRKRDAGASVFTHQQVNDPGGGEAGTSTHGQSIDQSTGGSARFRKAG